jgi:hypothetical protein
MVAHRSGWVLRRQGKRLGALPDAPFLHLAIHPGIPLRVQELGPEL